jgi:uncharacterized PurR-regulated membrane protein YhhQ (DUF165 family)
MKRALLVLAYVASIVAVNWAFTLLPPLTIFGAQVPSATILVGVIFILRDFAQRAIGHGVLLAMGAGSALSYLLAGPEVALASGAAFAASELVDWAVYSFTRRPFGQRILASSLLGTPVDSALFLARVSPHRGRWAHEPLQLVQLLPDVAHLTSDDQTPALRRNPLPFEGRAGGWRTKGGGARACPAGALGIRRTGTER